MWQNQKLFYDIEKEYTFLFFPAIAENVTGALAHHYADQR